MAEVHRNGPAALPARPSFGRLVPFPRSREASELVKGPPALHRSEALTDVEDLRLLDAVGVGSLSALSELFRRHAPATYELVRLLAEAPAAEAVLEDVFVCLWRRSGRLEDPVYNVRLGLLAMARRRCVAHGRFPAVPPAQEKGTSALGAIRGLWDEQRHALALSVLGQATLSEVAVVLGTDRRSAGSCVREGLREARLRLVPTRPGLAGDAPSASPPPVRRPSVQAKGGRRA